MPGRVFHVQLSCDTHCCASYAHARTLEHRAYKHHQVAIVVRVMQEACRTPGDASQLVFLSEERGARGERHVSNSRLFVLAVN